MYPASAWRGYLPTFPGRVALLSYVLSLLAAAVLSNYFSIWLAALIEVCCFIALFLLMFSIPIMKVVLCAYFLGSVFALGLLSFLSGNSLCWFGFYAMAMSFFHFSEYMVTSIFNPHTLCIDSFLLNHSTEYGVAAIVSWVEFWVELYFFPNLKSFHYFSMFGAIMVVLGESLRKVSMITAGSNFTHLVQYHKRSSHELVTSGIYGIFRHPSYVGWFIWSVGTQVLLCNPVCLVSYAAASWVFFKERIYDEEENLILFFKEDYLEYKKKVCTGLPLISGYPQKEAEALLKLQEKYSREL